MDMSAYGCSASMLGESLRFGQSTAMDCLYRVSTAGVSAYTKDYLRSPAEEETKLRLCRAEKVNVPGLFR